MYDHSSANIKLSPEHSPQSDESSFIARLLDSESHHMPHPDYLLLCQDSPIQLASRQDSINYILKVHAHYQFKPVTAFLSITYLDRFLSSHKLQESRGWTFQLVSVACLSIAAKMEEIYVPLLLDLQLDGDPTCRYVFEPKTVQRMELWVMATLNWRLRSVTPFDYLHYFISKLPSCKSDSIPVVQSLASNLILNTTRVIDFLGFPPSVIAAAAVISAAGDGEIFDERVNREMVRSCHQLMEEYLLDTCPAEDLKVTSIDPNAPPSPIGVLDAAACTSCDTHPENLASVSGSGSGAGGAEPENKRQRLSTSDVQEPQP
ncbi:hypothetical protein ACJIZ3_001244 [Penstemon smallii]|uniref:Uncharacterized protein n=1 Tax=Penstemon smallii TaxID=265156 RepID=A0ABD3U4T1_9LAMI